MPPALSIQRLSLSCFRNYSGLHLETGPEPVVLTGPNGAGKTNILEAISLFTAGRGLRGQPYEVMLQKDCREPIWAVSARVHGPHGECVIGTSWAQPEGSQASGRQARIDGVNVRGSGAFADHIRIIWLTPAMDRLFSGPAGDRRRFVDRMVTVLDAGHPRRAAAFEKLMRERNRLLAAGSYDRAWVAALEEQLAETGVAIAAARLTATDALQSHIDSLEAGGEKSPFPSARVALAGWLEERLRQNPAVQTEDEYRKMLHDSRHLDQAAGRMLNGPHRSDLHVVHAQKQMAARDCSTGEQKALLTGLVLAHAKAVKAAFEGVMPVLLLDEISAHLDAGRRAGLFDELCALGAQAWMTGTDAIQFEALRGRAQFFVAGDGRADQVTTTRQA
ncbi:MAG TPA: DNA replication/repair protein RecF [Rhodobacteraceae bacterium]|nr:DNA replication/repair protein RecF [Paracoccaceae bacterium]